MKAQIACHNCLTVYQIPIPVLIHEHTAKFICEIDKTVLVVFQGEQKGDITN